MPDYRDRTLHESHDWRGGIAADLTHALRAIRLNRSFSAIVILTLAIGTAPSRNPGHDRTAKTGRRASDSGNLNRS